MQLAYLKDALNSFAKRVIADARGKLEKEKKNASRKLSDGLGYDLKIFPNSFSLKFTSEAEYFDFIDKGVSGVQRKYPKTPYSYKRKGGKRGLKGMPPPAAFDKWTVRKGIAPRDKKGRFLTRKTLNFLIAKSVFEKGIRPSLFFTIPFRMNYKSLPDKLIEQFALDVDEFLKFTK